MQVYTFNIDRVLNKFEFEKFYGFVGKEKKEKVAKFIKNEDKIRSLVGDVLARVLICESLNLKNKDLKYKYTEYGKPYLNNNVEFNISHSGKYVVVGIDDEPLGIDVEEIKDIEFEGIAKGYYDESEYNWIINHKKGEQIKCFYILWTLKESYVKYIGKGLSINFNSFKFIIDEKNNNFMIDNKENHKTLYFKNYNILDKYSLSICSLKNEVVINEIDYDSLAELMIKYM